MTGTLTHISPGDAARYLDYADLVDGVVAAMEHSDNDLEDAQLLDELAEATKEQAALTRAGVDVDDARVLALLADVANARAYGRPRKTGLLPELEQRPYPRAVLDRMADPADDQPGWVLAVRLNALIDHALDLGLGTRLAERLALAVTRRPDGLNAEEHEQADGIGVDELDAA
ncbi:hypothetical protein ACFORH_43115 [Amycolatopsis roodepoortensis]|uniref:DUF222 domain-containing protein n=1 Tax=Amycolatopsis roodepoortensis TaxID=700274 RepID=A0ABR9LJT6_9PSEU|nr:hypothetical protein [Amycolatopsis roodepoortensis]MBE1580468.1 hypothetical protein [Amycolatopsis roodepoortensis]